VENLILKILKSRNLSQGWLSRKSGVDRVQLWKIVHGKVPNIRASTAIKIAKVLGVPVEEIWKS